MKKVLTTYLNSVKPDDVTDKSQLQTDYSSINTDADSVLSTENLISTSYLLGIEHAERERKQKNITAADEEIQPIPFTEAVNFLKGKVPLTKKEWSELEPRLRFRAFTVAKLAECDYIEQAKHTLAMALEEGKGYSETWQELKQQVDVDALKIKPGYWENVYRTNTQSSYVAGKLQQYEKFPPQAYRLLVIQDGRTSDICRNLLRDGTRYGLTLPAKHRFWKTYGFPPYHYQCRTGIQAVYSGVNRERYMPVENPSMKSISESGFEVQDGFGGNPLDKESWWRMTKGMAIRSAKYGIFTEIEEYAKQNGLKNFSLDLVNGSDTRALEKSIYKANKATLADPSQKEIAFAKILEENGHSVYFTPINTRQNIKNPEGIIDGKVGEMKILTSSNIKKIKDRLNEAILQNAQIACIRSLNTTAYTLEEAKTYIQGFLKQQEGILEKVYYCYGNILKVIKK